MVELRKNERGNKVVIRNFEDYIGTVDIKDGLYRLFGEKHWWTGVDSLPDSTLQMEIYGEHIHEALSGIGYLIMISTTIMISIAVITGVTLFIRQRKLNKKLEKLLAKLSEQPSNGGNEFIGKTAAEAKTNANSNKPKNETPT